MLIIIIFSNKKTKVLRLQDFEFVKKGINENFANNETIARKNYAAKERLNLIASHMFKQQLEHKQANVNTTMTFNKILNEIEDVTGCLKESFNLRGVDSSDISFETSSQKNFAMMNILWHAISFSVRGNIKPQALYREGRLPLFTGRVIALNGNFKDVILKDKDNTEILKYEIASLYIPADAEQKAILTIKHLSNKEFEINQLDAPREFILKVIEIICGGGFYHETGL